METINAADAVARTEVVDATRLRFVFSVNGTDVVAVEGTPQTLRTLLSETLMTPLPVEALDIPLMDGQPETTPRAMMGL